MWIDKKFSFDDSCYDRSRGGPTNESGLCSLIQLIFISLALMLRISVPLCLRACSCVHFAIELCCSNSWSAFRCFQIHHAMSITNELPFRDAEGSRLVGVLSPVHLVF
jgi:hypothetical protein